MDTCIHGLMAEFEDGHALLEAAQKTSKAGYKDVRAYSPYWIEGLAEALGSTINIAPYVVLIGLALGAFIGFFLQYFTSVEAYALNVGGRPLNSWPAFLPITFEMAILFGGVAVVGAFFAQTGLPVPYHSAFNARNFELASHSGFFLCVESSDKRFDPESTKVFLEGLGAKNVSEVSC